MNRRHVRCGGRRGCTCSVCAKPKARTTVPLRDHPVTDVGSVPAEPNDFTECRPGQLEGRRKAVGTTVESSRSRRAGRARRRVPTLSEEQIDEAVRLYNEEGLTLRQVAERLGGSVSHGQVAYVFRRRRIPTRKAMETDQVAVDRSHIMWALGLTKTEIANALEVSWTSADRYLAKPSPFKDWKRPDNER